MQGTAGGRIEEDDPGEVSAEPGGMISVALIQGDLEVSAAGTVTHVDGDRLYAFGHPFLSSGPAELPFSAAEVITLVPNFSNSFKIVGSGSPLGTIVSDRSAGLTGIVGKTAALTSVNVQVTSEHGAENYTFEIVRDPLLTPYLLQMALFSSIDATQRQVGASTLRLRGEARFGDDMPPLKLDNIYSEPTNAGLTAATSTSLLLYYLLLNENATVEAIELEVDAVDREEWAEIDRVWTDKRKVRAGETIELSAALKDSNAPSGSRHSNTAFPRAHRPALCTSPSPTPMQSTSWSGKAFSGCGAPKIPPNSSPLSTASGETDASMCECGAPSLPTV